MFLDQLFSMLKSLIKKTAWSMEPPTPWSSFHILFFLCGLSTAGILAFVLSRVPSLNKGVVLSGNGSSHIQKNKPIRLELPAVRLLWLCGVLLALSEIYKQLFLYEIVNQNHYDWWYFPFQLCSTPMYLCLLFPVLPCEKLRKAAAAYLESFGLLGGIMALAEPSGLMHSYWTLTIHGFLWHIVLVFIACICAGFSLGGKYTRDFADALLLFFIFCLIATGINISTGGKADMFYISPYYPVTQVVFHQISLICGIMPGIIIYLFSVCISAFFCHRLVNKIPFAPSKPDLKDLSTKKQKP